MKTNIRILLCIFAINCVNANPRISSLFNTANVLSAVRYLSNSSKSKWNAEQEEFIKLMKNLKEMNKDSSRYWIEITPNLKSHQTFSSFSKKDQEKIKNEYNVVIKHYNNSLHSKP